MLMMPAHAQLESSFDRNFFLAGGLSLGDESFEVGLLFKVACVRNVLGSVRRRRHQSVLACRSE